jgi:phospholipid-binding lipoprotein MlaA
LVDDAGDSNRLTLLGVVQTRSELLSASRMLEQVALDRYVFVREGYLARRRNQVWDGNPPPEPDDEE